VSLKVVQWTYAEKDLWETFYRTPSEVPFHPGRADPVRCHGETKLFSGAAAIFDVANSPTPEPINRLLSEFFNRSHMERGISHFCQKLRSQERLIWPVKD
jgi:hypothetical protein